MTKIGLLSDTHGYIDPNVYKYFADVDEIWHAGDIGNLSTLQELQDFKPVRAVYGNIDGTEIRKECPEIQEFTIDGVQVFIIHIGGYPNRYSKGVSQLLQQSKPNLFISGHSHILKVMHDKKLNLLHMNPGAAGFHGFHKVKTLLRFDIDQGKIDNLEVIELGKRGH